MVQSEFEILISHSSKLCTYKLSGNSGIAISSWIVTDDQRTDDLEIQELSSLCEMSHISPTAEPINK